MALNIIRLKPNPSIVCLCKILVLVLNKVHGSKIMARVVSTHRGFGLIR